MNKIASELLKIAKELMANEMYSVYKKFSKNSFLYKFFKEKDIRDKTFKKMDRNGVEHYIPNTVVVEHMANASSSEQRDIENVLRKIDFANGDINHFLEHLAGAIADKYNGILSSEDVMGKKKVKKKVIRHRSPMPPPSKTHKDKKLDKKRNECRKYKYKGEDCE